MIEIKFSKKKSINLYLHSIDRFINDFMKPKKFQTPRPHTFGTILPTKSS